MNVLGVDIGGTNVRATLVQDGEIVEIEKHPRPERPAGLIAQLVAIRDSFESRAGPIVAAGVGCAGLIRSNGVIATSPNIPGYDAFPLGSRLTTALGVPVAVENDATAALWAEMCSGAATGYDDVLLVTLGTGIGGGLALDGSVRRGGQGFAGEIGHMVVLHDGPLCTCGRRGCWETLGSGRALGEYAREAAAAGRAARVLELAGGEIDRVVGEDVATALAEGDAEAQALLDKLGYWVGLGISNLVTILDPQLTVIGGGLAAIGEPLVTAVSAGVRQTTVDYEERGGVSLELVRHHTDGGSLGAALLAVELL